MFEIEFEPRATDPLRVVMTLEDGSPIDPGISAARFSVLVAPGTYTDIVGTPFQDGFLFDVGALSGVVPVSYTAILYVDWGEGWRRLTQGRVKILRGREWPTT